MILALVLVMLLSSCGDARRDDATGKHSKALDIAKLEELLQMKGTTTDGEFKITIAQNDLNVIVDNPSSSLPLAPQAMMLWAQR